MTPQFLRSEAARFREMAEATEREASRQRLLAMAADYEARASEAEAMQPAPGPAPDREAVPEPELEAAPAADEASDGEMASPGKSRTRLRLTRKPARSI